MTRADEKLLDYRPVVDTITFVDEIDDWSETVHDCSFENTSEFGLATVVRTIGLYDVHLEFGSDSVDIGGLTRTWRTVEKSVLSVLNEAFEFGGLLGIEVEFGDLGGTVESQRFLFLLWISSRFCPFLGTDFSLSILGTRLY